MTAANENELPMVAAWDEVFADEPMESVKAALTVVAGLVGDPAMLRRIADELDVLHARPDA